MSASAEELAQLKAWLRAMLQLIAAIEAREKAESSAELPEGTPPARLTRIA
jgi:hypothetical protein